MTHFESELQHLKNRLLTMAGLAESAVRNAIRALMDRDTPLAERVIADDEKIDALDLSIHDSAIRLLAKAPLAGQLRLITTAMDLARDVERIGDEATSIARRALELNRESPLDVRVDIAHLAELSLRLLKAALDAFVQADTGAARATIPRDKEIDALHKEIQKSIVTVMIAEPSAVTRCLHILTVSKCLERIGDHGKNIAEEVVFLYEGEDIRHPENEIEGE